MVVKSLNIVTEEKAKKSKEVCSRFFITINTNKTDKAFADKLLKAYHLWYEYMDNPKAQLLKFLSGTPEYEKIKSISVDLVTEVGSIQGRYHIHSIIDIIHETKLQIKLDKLRTFINAATGTNCHVDIKYVRDSKITLQDYIRKNPVN